MGIETKSLRVALYLRVSHDRGGRSTSVIEQEAELRAQAAREGWEIVAVFSDPDFSASRHRRRERPDYAELVNFVEAGKCDLVACWSSSRLHRDQHNYLMLRDLCADNGVLWSYRGRTYDLSRTEDRFQTGLDVLINEKYADETSDQIRRNMAANAMKGRPHGRFVYGYVRIYDDKTKAFVEQVEDPEQAAVIREAARRVLAGQTLYSIATDFNRRGILTPAKADRWQPTTVRRLLLNKTYIGDRVYRGKVVGDAIWPPILSEADHIRLESILIGPSRTTQRPMAVRHLLVGIALCGACDGPITQQRNRGTPSYTCLRYFHVSRKESAVDELVIRALMKRLRRKDAVALLKADSRSAVKRQKAQDELAVLEGRLSEFVSSAAAPDGITAASLARIEAELQPQIDAACKRAQPPSQAPSVVEELIGRPDIEPRWEKLDLNQKRAVIKSLMRIRILPAGKGHRVFDPHSIEITFLGSR